MEIQALVNSALTSTWVVTTGIAVMLRAASKAQRRSLRRLRDKDIAWGIYVHRLRSEYAIKTGHKPPKLPPTLYDERADDSLS